METETVIFFMDDGTQHTLSVEKDQADDVYHQWEYFLDNPTEEKNMRSCKIEYLMGKKTCVAVINLEKVSLISFIPISRATLIKNT